MHFLRQEHQIELIFDLFKTLIPIPHLIHHFWYKVDTVLYAFLETGTSDSTHICRDQLPKCLGFSLYTLSFFLNSPFNDSYVFFIKE